MSFFEQDSEKLVVTFPVPINGTINDIDVSVTANSLRISLRGGDPIVNAGLAGSVKPSTARYGTKTWTRPSGESSVSVMLAIDKAEPTQWETLFSASEVDMNTHFPEVLTRMEAKEGYEGNPAEEELKFDPGDVVTVTFQDPSGWYYGFIAGNCGQIPSNYFVDIGAAMSTGTAAFDVDEPDRVIYPLKAQGRGGPRSRGAQMGGIGFGSSINNELGNALRRRTVMNPEGINSLREEVRNHDMQQARKQQEPKKQERVRVVESYEGDPVNGYIPITVDDIIVVLSKNENGWWEGECNGQRGLFPSTFTEPYNEPVAAVPQLPTPSGGRGLRHVSGAAAGQARKEDSAQDANVNQFTAVLKKTSPAGQSSARAQPRKDEPPAENTNPFGAHLKKPQQPAPVPPQKDDSAQEPNSNPFGARLKKTAPAGQAQPQQREAQADGENQNALPFARKLKSVGTSGDNAGSAPQPKAQPAPPGPKPRAQPQQSPQKPAPVRPSAQKPAPKPAQQEQQEEQKGQPSQASSSSEGEKEAIRDWPSALGAFEDFCGVVSDAVAGAAVRGSKSDNVVGTPDARGSAVCSLDGHTNAGNMKEAVPLSYAVIPVLAAFLKSTGANIPQTKDLSVEQTSIVLTNACMAGGKESWDVLSGFCAFVSQKTNSAVGANMASYMKAKSASEVVFAAAYALKLDKTLPVSCDAHAVADVFLQLASVQLTLADAARLASALAKDTAAVAACRDTAVVSGARGPLPVVGGDSGLAIAILPKVGGIAVYAPEVGDDGHTPAVAEPVFAPLAESYGDLFSA